MKRTLLAGLCLAVLAAPAAAQEQEIREAGLPRRLEWQLLDFFRDVGTLRPTPPYRIEAGDTVRGNVGIVGGDAHVAGRLEGNLVVVNGNVVVEGAGVIAGDVTVVGGQATMADGHAVRGTLTVYGRGEEGARAGADRDDDWWPRPRVRRRRAADDGIARFTLRTDNNYNRVEGLPVMFGPMIRTAGANPLQIEAFAIWRTHGPTWGVDEFGYHARVEQFLGGRRALRVGAAGYSDVEPIETAGVRDLEASLAAGLLHADFRDYYGREGWAAYLRHAPRGGRLDTSIEFRDERHGTAPGGDPWTLFRGGRAWRLQPAVADGQLQALRGAAQWSTVPRHRNRAGSSFARLEIDQGLGGRLATPLDVLADCAPDGCVPDWEGPASDVRHGAIDLRHHLRVSGNSTLSLRGFAAGSLTGRALPPQFQRALGGVGSIPGIGHFRGDCGARRLASNVTGDATVPPVYRGYGCDRVALLQAEYSGGLDISLGTGRWDDDWRFDMDGDPSWVLFMNAGRGWALPGSETPLRADTELLVDAGAGILFGRTGIYAAVPLRGADRSLSFFIRLGRRF
jgi:hypothetical protein